MCAVEKLTLVAMTNMQAVSADSIHSLKDQQIYPINYLCVKAAAAVKTSREF